MLSPLAIYFNTPEDYQMLKNWADGHAEMDKKISDMRRKKIDLTEFEKKLEKEIDKSIKKTLDKVFK